MKAFSFGFWNHLKLNKKQNWNIRIESTLCSSFRSYQSGGRIVLVYVLDFLRKKYWNSKIMTSNSSEKNHIKYVIRVKTGHGLNAGTDSSVYIKIYGSKAKTDQIHLSKINAKREGPLFEKAKLDEFHIMAPNVGQVIQWVILHANGFHNLIKGIQIVFVLDSENKYRPWSWWRKTQLALG